LTLRTKDGIIDMMKWKDITVEMTFSWTFNEKDWSEEKKHVQMIKNEPRIVFGYDMMNSFHCLNDITYPELKTIKVTDADK
jgi:hypothetical protein